MNIPVGITDFNELRQKQFSYIDKSGLIASLLDYAPAKATLIARPHGFGKTLGLSMLFYFLDNQSDSKKLFAGLEIAKNSELCTKWMNQYPTLFISFGNIAGKNFDCAYQQLLIQISKLYQKHHYLLDCSYIDEDDKKIFRQLELGEAPRSIVIRAISLLMRMMETYYQKSVILLIDDYDVPIVQACQNGYFSEMYNVINEIMNTALKDNPALKFAVLTGCLWLSGSSFFSRADLFANNTIITPFPGEYFGFTSDDINILLQEQNAQPQAETIKSWYGDYHIGEHNVYCPANVMRYLDEPQIAPHTKPADVLTGLQPFIISADISIKSKIEALLSGDYITENVGNPLPYHTLYSTESNLWNYLYMMGYLTQAPVSDKKEISSNTPMALSVPNREALEVLTNIL